MRETAKRWAFVAVYSCASFFIGAICQKAIDEESYLSEFSRLDQKVKEAQESCGRAAGMAELVTAWQTSAETCIRLSSIRAGVAKLENAAAPIGRRPQLWDAGSNPAPGTNFLGRGGPQ